MDEPLVVLDLAIYLQHVLFHAVPAFWRLHRVHHTDMTFDLTTAVRFHPVDELPRTASGKLQRHRLVEPPREDPT